MAWTPRDVKDQIVEFPNRFKIDGVSHTIEPDFGTITEPGTSTNREFLMAIENFLGTVQMRGTCSTAATTAAKTATFSQFDLLADVYIVVVFANQNTVANPTLDVNGTGAKAIQVNGAACNATQLPKVALLQYDGTYWQLLNPTVAVSQTIGSTFTVTFNGYSEPTLNSLSTGSFAQPVNAASINATSPYTSGGGTIQRGQNIDITLTCGTSSGAYTVRYSLDANGYLSATGVGSGILQGSGTYTANVSIVGV
jgi:hypothetical protein